LRRRLYGFDKVQAVYVSLQKEKGDGPATGQNVSTGIRITADSGRLASALHVMAGLVPAIHVFLCRAPESKTWMPATSAGTTTEKLTWAAGDFTLSDESAALDGDCFRGRRGPR